MPVVKNIKQRTTNNSFNTYPIGMNAEFITIPAGTANLYENNVNADEGMGILKNYIDEQISIAKVNFFVNYTDINGQAYNLRVYNDDTTNGQELRNILYNIGTNESTTRAISTSNDINMLDIKELYAPNFYDASDLFNAKAEMIPALEIKNINSISFSKVTNISNMFLAQRKLQKINLLSFGHNVEDTSYMFQGCYNLTNISNFDTSNVKYMDKMFCNCKNLTTIPNFNTSNVINMSSMFQNCRNLINISDLNTDKVNNMSYMFQQAGSLVNTPKLNLASVVTTVDMYAQAYALNDINDTLGTITENIKNTVSMFEGCLRLNPDGYAIARNVLFQPNLVNTAYMFCTTNLNRVYLNQLFDGNNGRCNASHMFDNCRNFTNCSAINGIWDAVYDMSYMFANCNKLNYINGFSANYVNGIRNMVYGCSALTNAAIFNLANGLPHYNNIDDSGKWNTLDYIGFTNNQMNIIANNPTVLNNVENKGWTIQKVKYELAYTYSNRPDTWLNYSLETTSVSSNAQALRNVFSNKDIDTTNIIKLNVINMPGVTNGRNLFASTGSNYNFSKMTNVEHLDMQDLQDASHLFYNDRNLISINNINCNNINNCDSMFFNCPNLKNISNFNTSKVTSMKRMFSFSSSGGSPRGNLTIIPNFDTSNVTDMSSMFYGGHFFTTLPNFNTINVTNMSGMLDGCSYLTTIPNFNTSKVTSMFSMLARCYNLTTIPNLNTSNVMNMYRMFAYCYNLITVSNFNTSNAITMFRTFDGCNNLVNVPNFNTPNVTNMKNIFLNCDSLSSQSIDNIAYSLPLYENIINGNPSVNQYIGLSNAQINSMSTNAKQAAENKGWMVLPQIRIDYTYTNGVNGINKIYNIDTMNGQQIRNSIKNVFSNLSVYEPGFYNLIVTDIVMTSTNCNISNLNGALGEGGPNVKNISLNDLDTNKTIDMSKMFYYFVGLINISNFDTSNVINMSNMFSGCQNLTNIPNLNTSKVTDMRDMFSGCYNLINIPNFNTSNVINMSSMFTRCENLTNIPSYLDMSKVTNLYGTFMYCNNLSLNSLQNIIISIPDRDQITETTTTTNLEYIGLSATQINNLPTYYKQIAVDKGWYVEGYEPKYTEMLVGTANALGDITFEDTETYPMRLTYDDMFGDYCLENTNQGKASTTSSATLTVSEDLLNVFDPMFRFLVYYSSETDYDFTRIYKNDELIYEYSDYDGDASYLDTTFWLEVQAGDVLKFEYEKDSSGDRGLDGCKIYISGWKNNKSYEVRYSTVDAPTTYITKFIPKEDN